MKEQWEIKCDEYMKTHIKVAEGVQLDETIKATLEWAKNVFEDAYKMGKTDQQKIDIEKLKDIMNSLMLDTKDKAEIIKAMEE